MSLATHPLLRAMPRGFVYLFPGRSDWHSLYVFGFRKRFAFSVGVRSVKQGNATVGHVQREDFTFVSADHDK